MSAESLCNRADALRRDGSFAEAQRLYRHALGLAPDEPAILNRLGLALANDARYDEAIAAFAEAAARCAHAAPLVNLGNALRSAARKREAVRAYRAALRREPQHAAALYNLHAALDDRAEARATLAAAAALRPSHAEARFFMAALEGETPRDVPAFLASSYCFVEAHPAARRFSDTFDTLAYALACARPDGAVIELGVRRGTSLCFLAARAAEVHGFDAFEGLPEPWGGQPAGLYTTGGELPDVPDNARLHIGDFADTLPRFVETHDEPIRLINVDCDLYASARVALEVLAPRIAAGAVLVFDEYLCNPGWEEEEHRAFGEIAEARDWRYAYVAFSLFTKQAAVRIE